SVRGADVHGRAADVLLPPNKDSGVPRHPLSRARCAVRKASAEYASLGGAPDGDYDLAAHVSRGANRLIQKTARIQLVRRCRAPGADAFAFIHRILAARRSTWFLGGNCGHEHGARYAH